MSNFRLGSKIVYKGKSLLGRDVEEVDTRYIRQLGAKTGACETSRKRDKLAEPGCRDRVSVDRGVGYKLEASYNADHCEQYLVVFRHQRCSLICFYGSD